VNFEFLSASSYDRWNAFVDSSLQGSIYAKTWYLDAVGFPYRIGVVLKNDNWLGGIVLTRNEIMTHANPLFVKYLGIVYEDFSGKEYNRRSQEIHVGEEIVRALRGIATFDYVFHPSFSNWLPFYWAKFRQETRYTYHIKRDAFDNIRKQFKQTVRTQERKAEKAGIEISSNVAPDVFFSILAHSFDKQGASPPFSYKKFYQFYSALRERDAIELLGAFDGHELHAVTGIVFDQKSANLLFNGTDPRYSSSAANTLLVIRTIETGLQKAAVFDFEGSMIKPVERFYRGFGGTLVPYYNIWKPTVINNLKRTALRIYKNIRYRR